MISLIIINFLLILILSSCRDIDTTTQIFPDGSCLRTVVATGDSSEIMNGSFPVPQDSSWTMTFDKQSDPDKYTAVKRFRRVSHLNQELADKPDTLLQLGISVQLKKKFRWFNTFYQYQETYHAANPYTMVPISDFLTEEELALYYLDEDTLDLDDRVGEWWAESLFQEFYQTLYVAIKNLNHSELTLDLLESKKDTLFETIKEDDISDEELPKHLEEVFGTTAVKLISEDITESIRQIERKNEFMMDLNGDYTNQVTMPGLILDTNASELEGNTASWEFNQNQLIWEDHVMWVESRIVNRWATIVTAVICICLILGLLIGAILGKRRVPKESV